MMDDAPSAFYGSWMELYENHIEPVLPDVSIVTQFHEWMRQYCSEVAPVFPVRAVPGTQRQRVYSTVDGTQLAPADNSPAWVVYALLVEQRLSSYQGFRDLISVMPTHMFDVRKFVRKYAVQTPNDFGWYVA